MFILPLIWYLSKYMETILMTQVIGAILGLLAVVFGAFGAHVLKKSFSDDQLRSFETGVKYQMYHAIVLLILSFNFGFTNSLECYIVYCFAFGTFLFSFSIYGLCYSAAKGKNWKFLGPVTPVGGLLLVLGWVLLLYSFIKGLL